MANVVLPTIIQGPARIRVGGVVIYVQQDISVAESADSWNPNTAFGELGERHKSRKDVLSFTPSGQVKAAHLDYYYAAFLTPASVIGSSILSGAVTIDSLAENVSYGWSRGGLLKPPGISAKPTSTLLGQMQVCCIGKATTQPLATDFWKAANGVPSADTSFEEDDIISDIYSMAIGARSSPYNGVGGMDGFELGFDIKTKEIPASDIGIADIVIESLSTTLSCAPSNLTEAQTDTLLGLQGASAILPGQAYAKAKEDLVVTGTQVGWVFTMKSMGAKRSDRVYQVGEHRFKMLEFVNQRTWTSGAANAMFAYTAPA